MPYVPKACGFVLVRDRGPGLPFEYLLLVSSRRARETGLPKGHVEPGETELETALRETAEETGLTRLVPDPWFRTAIHYPIRRKSRTWHKTVVYFLARLAPGEDGAVHISDEHSGHAWLPLGDALGRLIFADLRAVVRDAALFLKDPALFELEPATEADAEAHLLTLPEPSDGILAHVHGAARIARTLATALVEAGEPVHVEAAAAGALLHDTGRVLGRHDAHQIEGLRHLRTTPLSPYGFACISHSTKGASDDALASAGMGTEEIQALRSLVDGSSLTWEERCVALADSCMKGAEPVPPTERFGELRERYGAVAIIDLQERLTEAIRRDLEVALGADPLALLSLGN